MGWFCPLTQPGTLVPPIQGTSSHFFFLSSLQVVSIVQYLLEGELEALLPLVPWLG